MKKSVLILFISLSALASVNANGPKSSEGKKIALDCKNNYKAANNPDIPANVSDEFCDCMAITYESKMTKEELKTIMELNKVDRNLKEKMAEVMQPCADDFAKKIELSRK